MTETNRRRKCEFTWRLRLLVAGVSLLNRWLLRRVEGLENVPQQGGFIAVANHLDFADGLLLAQILDFERNQPVHFVSYAELFDIPVVGAVLRAGEGIVLDRRSREGIERALDEAVDYLVEKEHGVALFPEAHVGRPGKMRRGRPGAALLAMRSGAPVLPCGLVGFEKLTWLDNKGVAHLGELKRRSIEVHIGTPLDLTPWRQVYSEADENVKSTILDGLTTLMMRVVAALSGQHYPYKAAELAETAGMVDSLPEWVKQYL